ncbi:MAG: hypothetical protein CM1200mP30_05210 [Pseudomonadota bacterium]|nr:MAG: hypothetical protein CM1200mP30_05210 [Pseudomonadota bacterium]
MQLVTLLELIDNEDICSPKPILYVRVVNTKVPFLLENFGLSDADMNTVFHAGERIGLGSATLREIHEFFRTNILRVHRC